MEKNTCRIVEGRLMLIDVAAGYASVQDVDAMIGMIGAELARLPASARVVIAADWRPCELFTDEVAARAVAMLTGANPRIERSAILHHSDAATSVLQVMRLVRESGSEHRRVFTDGEKMQRWLGDVLTERERARLRTFLAHR